MVSPSGACLRSSPFLPVCRGRRGSLHAPGDKKEAGQRPGNPLRKGFDHILSAVPWPQDHVSAFLIEGFCPFIVLAEEQHDVLTADGQRVCLGQA